MNIFGGIAKCDVIAGGILAAAQEVHLAVPLVVRLEGTNVELGRKLLDERRHEDRHREDDDEAATQVVAAVQGRRRGR